MFTYQQESLKRASAGLQQSCEASDTAPRMKSSSCRKDRRDQLTVVTDAAVSGLEHMLHVAPGTFRVAAVVLGSRMSLRRSMRIPIGVHGVVHARAVERLHRRTRVRPVAAWSSSAREIGPRAKAAAMRHGMARSVLPSLEDHVAEQEAAARAAGAGGDDRYAGRAGALRIAVGRHERCVGASDIGSRPRRRCEGRVSTLVNTEGAQTWLAGRPDLTRSARAGGLRRAGH